MHFETEANLLWWQAAEALAAVPWDRRRRIDREKLNRLEEALAKFDFREIRENLPREFWVRGIHFILEKASPRKDALQVKYMGRSGKTVRGEVVFNLERTLPGRYRTAVVAEQERMDHFLREDDAIIFKEIVDNFQDSIRVNF